MTADKFVRACYGPFLGPDFQIDGYYKVNREWGVILYYQKEEYTVNDSH